MHVWHCLKSYKAWVGLKCNTVEMFLPQVFIIVVVIISTLSLSEHRAAKILVPKASLVHYKTKSKDDLKVKTHF